MQCSTILFSCINDFMITTSPIMCRIDDDIVPVVFQILSDDEDQNGELSATEKTVVELMEGEEGNE